MNDIPVNVRRSPPARCVHLPNKSGLTTYLMFRLLSWRFFETLSKKHGKMVWFLLSSSPCLCLSFFFYPLSFFSLFLANPLPHSKETASCAQQLHRLSSSQEQALRQFSGIFKIEILHFLSINSLFPWTNFYSRQPSQRRCFSSTCHFRDGFYEGLKPRDVDVKLPC